MIPDWVRERRRMVDEQLRGHGIVDKRVLAAMATIPREDFVPVETRVMSYANGPVELGFGQTISQPYMTALMAQLLELKGTEMVLDVGSGSGYAAAVLGAMANRVISIELIKGLVALARRNLQCAGLDANVTVVAGDGSIGYPDGAPYDAIFVAAGAPAVPDALTAQLRDPGRLVIPVGDRYDQSLTVVTKCGGAIESRVKTQCRFVLLRGDNGWR